MLEDLGNHGGIYDGGDDRQGAAAVGALFNIDIEYPFENRAQLRRASVAAGGASAWSAEGVWALTGTPGKPGPGRSPAWRPEDGMTSGRSLALGASTPWKRMRWSRGRGNQGGESLQKLHG